MKVRQLRKRQLANLGQIIRKRAWWSALMASYEGPDDDFEFEHDDYGCTHCGGEGYREVDDPLWDDCDEFGYGPCRSCHGTGLRSRQWVF